MTEAAEAWVSFCERVRDLGVRMLENEEVKTDREAAETIRYLTRELRVGLEGGLGGSDGLFPHLQRLDESSSGPTAPNIDNWYMKAALDPRFSYRLTAILDSVFEINISVIHFAGQFRVLAERFRGDLKLDAKGQFNLILGGEERSGDWISLPEDADALFVRVYYYNWDRETPPSFQLTRIDSEGETPELLSGPALSFRLADIAAGLEKNSLSGYPAYIHDQFKKRPVNTVGPPIPMPGGGLNIQYGGGLVSIADDQALVVEIKPPKCRYYGFHLYSIPWFEPIDIFNRITALNGRQVHIDSDGVIRLVIAHRDPGVQNWLDAAGMRLFSFFFRWIWAESSPTPHAKVVRFGELNQALPSDTPFFDAAQRHDQIARRRAHLSRRFRY